MRRDMDLVRKILLDMERKSFEELGAEIHIPGYSQLDIHHHLKLMTQAGLIEAANISANNDEYFIPTDITWYGHDFMDAARDDTRWNKAKSVAGKVGGVAFDILREILKELAEVAIKTQMGLP